MEQRKKQVKQALGFCDYQVRNDTAMRRHWQLAFCAFSFCWQAYGRLPADDDEMAERTGGRPTRRLVGKGEEGRCRRPGRRPQGQ